MFQSRDDLVLAKQSAYIFGTSTIDVKVDSLDKLYVEDLILVFSSLVDDFLCVENVTNHDVARNSSQFYVGEEAEIYVSSDVNNVVDLAYDEEASYEEDDEIGYSNQGEENDITRSSSYESDVDWEEESNEESKCPYPSESITSFSRSENENEIPSLNCINQHVVEGFEEELYNYYNNT